MSGEAAPRRVGIAPSILTADLGRLADVVAAAEAGGADVMHIDVMDGQFVPQISFGPLIVEAVRQAVSLPIEAHMMVADPLDQLEPLAEAGADRLIFHLRRRPISRSARSRGRASWTARWGSRSAPRRQRPRWSRGCRSSTRSP